MSELPPGWDHFCLADAGGTVGGKTPSKAVSRYWAPAEIPWASPKDMKVFLLDATEDRIARAATTEGGMTVLPTGSVLMVTRSGILAHSFPVAIAQVPMAINQDIKAVLPNQLATPRYLAYVVRAHEREVLHSCTKAGTTVASVETPLLERLGLPLAPLPEQKRIADKLDALLARVDACRGRLDRVPGILKRLRQSVLAAATSGELTREWREAREMDGIRFERRVPLGTLCTESFYGPRFGKDEYNTSGIPTIRTTDMTRGGRITITSDTPRVSVPKGKLEHFAVRKGDLLVTRTGSIGVMAVFDDEYVAVPSAYLIRFRFRPEVLPRFVFFCLMAPYGQELLGLSTTAVTQPNINAEAIKRIDIPVPSLEEQSEMIRLTDELLAFADRVEARLRSGEELMARVVPAILHKAFRGQLVPQDPSDEPASDLLAKLRAQQANAAAETPRRRQKKQRKQSTMSSIEKEAVRAAILKVKADCISFDELRARVSGDYESLKAALFELLEEPSPVVRQVFDKKAKAMRLERVIP